MTVISVIVGSTRQGRFSEKPAQWIFQRLSPLWQVFHVVCSSLRAGGVPASQDQRFGPCAGWTLPHILRA